MMSIGFSSLACPEWGLETIVTKAAAMGFQGVELRGLQGELHLPLAPDLAGDPTGVRTLFADHQIELVCLGASARLTARRPREVAREKASLLEFIELASRLGCPFVRVLLGDVEPGDSQQACLTRVLAALSSLAPIAARHGVTLLVENGGDFPGSQPLWFLIDAVAHPCVRACWSQATAMTVGERPTTSIPRLRQKMSLVHLCDARYDGAGVLLGYTPPGEGDAEVARQLELLKGVIYSDFVIFEWPRLWNTQLAAADDILPAAADFLRRTLDAKPAPLSAYKGDKNAPRLAPLPGRPLAAT